jgi:DNA-binding PadR family transcriptional regulator
MPIHHAVLGLLADGPSYGYELKANFERAIGPQWGALNIGHLYQVLDRLERDGLVTKRDIEQTRRPDKVVYRLSKQGRVELDRWLGEPATRPGGYRDDFFLKLFVASRLGEEQLRAALQVQRLDYLAELSALGDLQARHGDDPLVALLLEAAILHTEANLQVVDRARRKARELLVETTKTTGDRPAESQNLRRRSSG